MKPSTASRSWISALVVAVLATTSQGQTIFNSMMDDLSRYFGSAARLIGATVAGVDKVQAATISVNDRQQAAEDLERISRALSMLRARQQPLVEEISRYTKDVREQGFNEQKNGNEWRLVMSSVVSISKAVLSTLDMVETSKWLKIAFDEKDRLATREVLMGRITLFDKLSQLPTPNTPEQLDQLDRTNRYYRQLIESLNDLNIALARAAVRLSIR
jgi:hypothetical protein